MATIDFSKVITAEQKAADALAQAMAEYSGAIQAHMEAKAHERHYDSLQSAISYRDDANEQFAAEAAALFVWRSAVWTYATAELEKVTSGQRAQPSVADLIGELPAFTWP